MPKTQLSRDNRLGRVAALIQTANIILEQTVCEAEMDGDCTFLDDISAARASIERALTKTDVAKGLRCAESVQLTEGEKAALGVIGLQ